jgi:hypothetical protein
VEPGTCEVDADHQGEARKVALEARIGMAYSSKVISKNASGASRGVLFGYVNGAMYWSRCGSKHLQLACRSFQGPALFAGGTGTRLRKELLIG